MYKYLFSCTFKEQEITHVAPIGDRATSFWFFQAGNTCRSKHGLPIGCVFWQRFPIQYSEKGKTPLVTGASK